MDIRLEGRCKLDKSFIAFKEPWQALDLTWVAIVATIDVVVANLFAYNDIHHVEPCVDATSDSSRNDAIGMKRHDEVRNACSRICLTYAALKQHDLTLSQTADEELLRSALYRLCILKHCSHLAVFYAHGRQHTYSLLHTYY